jgi:hypothetical protein
MRAVLIALLVVLGVDLVVVLAIAVLIIGRKRWLMKQPGEFTGVISVSSGEVDGLGPKWKRGCGRWVRDVLVWSRAPFLFRNVLIPVDSVAGERQAGDGEVKQLGDRIVVGLVAGSAGIEVAVDPRDHDRVISGPVGAVDVDSGGNASHA